MNEEREYLDGHPYGCAARSGNGECDCGWSIKFGMAQPLPKEVALPIQGRPEREHLYRWVVGEEEYVHNKFDNQGQRDRHDATLQRHDIDEFWTRQVSQYYDRARVFLNEALMLRMSADDPKATESAIELEKMAQQAICKAFMTAKGFAESAIRAYGQLPKPGLSSGYVEPWEEGNYNV